MTICTIRELRITDTYWLHKMYDSLSEESKRFFHPDFLGFKSISFKWFLVQIALLLSSIKILRKLLLRLYPYSVFLSLVAFDEQKELVAFAFLKAKMRLPNDAILAELGICVSEDYQSKGLGFRLMTGLMELGQKQNFHEMFLTVHPDNVRAKRLFEKYGFRKTLIIKNGDSWHGRNYDPILMQLQSTHSEVTKIIFKFLNKSRREKLSF